MTKEKLTKVITATEAANKFGGMLDEVTRGASMFVVTKMGKASAVLLSVEQFRGIMEDAEIASEEKDPAFQELLEEAKEDFRLGKTVTLEELDKELGFDD